VYVEKLNKCAFIKKIIIGLAENENTLFLPSQIPP
jgi:hypothetical protein